MGLVAPWDDRSGAQNGRAGDLPRWTGRMALSMGAFLAVFCWGGLLAGGLDSNRGRGAIFCFGVLGALLGPWGALVAGLNRRPGRGWLVALGLLSGAASAAAAFFAMIASGFRGG